MFVSWLISLPPLKCLIQCYCNSSVQSKSLVRGISLNVCRIVRIKVSNINVSYNTSRNTVLQHFHVPSEEYRIVQGKGATIHRQVNGEVRLVSSTKNSAILRSVPDLVKVVVGAVPNLDRSASLRIAIREVEALAVIRPREPWRFSVRNHYIHIYSGLPVVSRVEPVLVHIVDCASPDLGQGPVSGVPIRYIQAQRAIVCRHSRSAVGRREIPGLQRSTSARLNSDGRAVRGASSRKAETSIGTWGKECRICGRKLSASSESESSNGNEL